MHSVEPKPEHKKGRKKGAKTKLKLDQLRLQKLQPKPHRYLVWDTKRDGLAIQVRPNKKRSWKFIYSFHGRVRWFHLGDASAMCLEQARKRAAELRVEVDNEKDPQAEKRARRSAGTFADLAERYGEHAKAENRSWKQADYLVRKHLLPKWGKLLAASITRDDVDAMKSRIAAPIVANQTLAAASAIFSWALDNRIGGITSNPCSGVKRNKTRKRERVLAESEVAQFWQAFANAGLVGAALKLVLLTGQRPGEVERMRREHLCDGWWELPGEPVPALGWPGTKNKENHRVWLPEPAQELLAGLSGDGFVLEGRGGRPVDHLDAAMRAICKKLGVSNKVTPHDLRRTHGTTVTGLGFGREAMNRIQNHREGGIASVYDRHQYAEENKCIMEAVAARLLALAEGRAARENVVSMMPRAG